MDSFAAHTLVRHFVTNCPEKVEDILVRCCADRKWYDEISNICLLRARDGQHPSTPASPASRLEINFAPTTPIPSLDSHHSVSPPPRQRATRHSPSDTRQFATPLSPPSTASSTASRSIKNEAATGEYILLLALSESGVEEEMVRMKPAPIKHSVIREDVVHQRNLDNHLTQADELQVTVPQISNPDTQIYVRVFECITLTWRRHNSNSTHSTKFYVVPKSALAIDVLLGYEDSGGYGGEYQPTFATPSHRQKDYDISEYQRNIRPTAPTPPAPSFHRSSITHDRSISAAPIDQHYRQSEHRANILTEEHVHNVARELSHHLQLSPTATVLGSRSSGIQHPQPLHVPVGPPTSAHDIDNSTSSTRLRLSLVWDVTTVNVWLDTGAPGEAFYHNFQQQVGKRKAISDRAMVRIYLRRDKNSPDDEVYELSLDEDELDADWETTVTWLEENKRDKSPHIYGKVEIDDG